MTITTNEAAILKALHTFQYVDGQDLNDLPIHTWSFTDDAAAAAGISIKGAKGVISSLVKKGYLTTSSTDLAAEDRNTTITAKGAEMNAELNAAPVEPVEEAAAEPAAEVKPLTRKQCLTMLAEAGYAGPTSYLMPKLREIVGTVQIHADHGDQADPNCAFCPKAETTTAPEDTK